MNDGYLTKSEVIKSGILPSCSKSRKYQLLNYLVYTGKLPVYEVGKLKMYRAQDLVLAIEACKVVKKGLR